MYKTILFDFDGTVFDTVEGITKSVRYAINKISLDAELDSLRCFAGPPLQDMFMERFGLDPEQAAQAVLDFRERYVPIGLYECRVFPGIKELLSTLKELGFKLGIATSKPQILAEQLLSAEDMHSLFDVICGSIDEGKDGTKAEVLSRAMTMLSALPSETLLVGDTKYDVLGAKTCGVDCIGVRYGYAAEDELEKAGAKYIVEDVASLKEFFISLWLDSAQTH